jgi:hypothetical protein
MKRALNIVFFLGIIVFGIVFYWRFRTQENKPAEEPVAMTTQPMNTVPRLAFSPPALDAGIDSLPAAIVRPRQVQAREAKNRDEQTLMQELRAQVKSDPAKAESLAREARQRFGDSPDADERDALLVDALINQQKIGSARSETYYYFDHHPGGRFSDHLAAMTGVHPRPAGPAK